MNTEPITIGTLIQAGTAAIIAIAVGFFGWDPTTDQITAVTTLQAFVIMITGVFMRQNSMPVSRVALTKNDVALLEAPK